MNTNREKEILESIRKQDKEKLKKLDVTPDEVDQLVKSIDNRLIQLNLEQSIEISKKINYNLPIDYCTYYAKQIDLHIKPNIFKLGNNEKVIRFLYDMTENENNSILNHQNHDSQYDGRIVHFAELEFGDTLAFDKETNYIVCYNHEDDTITQIAITWDEFENKLY